MRKSVRLPPLNALRVFESAARHLSFTKAAAELFVTQGAVSHQIKALEEFLGQPLFLRRNRKLLLTDAGQAYLLPVRKALDDLRWATQQLKEQDSEGVLTVAVLPSFAARWLVPRLARFRQLHPEIDIRLAPSAQLVEFSQSDMDVGIRYGRGHYPGLKVYRLMTEDIFPVCSPSLLEGPHPLRTPDDLVHHHLLHDDVLVDWRTWLLAAGVHHINVDRGTILDDSAMVIQAALAGHGVALARSVLVEDELKAGHLLRPFELSLPAEYAYYLVCPEPAAGRPKIVAFRDWLFSEVNAPRDSASPPGVKAR